jgi:hypothetical protein
MRSKSATDHGFESIGGIVYCWKDLEDALENIHFNRLTFNVQMPEQKKKKCPNCENGWVYEE